MMILCAPSSGVSIGVKYRFNGHSTLVVAHAKHDESASLSLGID